MATIINNQPPVQNQGSNGSNFLLAAIVILFIIFLFFYFGLPYLRMYMGTPQINVPGKINVNVNGGKY